jgi:hypothetical protein
MDELLAEPDEFTWLVTGMLASPTYGQVAGEQKSLKTYLAAMVQVGLAAGVPILGRFQPPHASPVVAYVGEGGRRPYMRRLRRIASAMGVNLADIPLYIVPEVRPIDTDGFKLSLQRDLDELEPGLVFLDPLYAYHGSRTKASDLHQEGALLSGLSGRCLAGGASLMVVNHMNQTGTGMDLKRITMAGSGEWVDSWMLVAHRETPDLENGAFQLRLEIGSRQWGGTRWDLDLTIGRFDDDTGTHDGDIEWDIQPATGGPGKPTGDDRDADTAAAITATLVDRPGITKTDVKQLVGGNAERFRRAFDRLADTGQIAHNKPDPDRKTGGRPAPRWYTPEVTDQTPGPKPPDTDPLLT